MYHIGIDLVSREYIIFTDLWGLVAIKPSLGLHQIIPILPCLAVTIARNVECSTFQVYAVIRYRIANQTL